MAINLTGEARRNGVVQKGLPLTVLEQIARQRKMRVEEASRLEPLESLQAAASERSEGRPFSEALVRPGISVIAEFKRRSPTRGDRWTDADLESRVSAYERGGAAALSVLTEADHFGGRMADLGTARASSGLPILCKDFVVDRWQLYKAAAVGADAILLIVGLLESDELWNLYEEARSIDLDSIVEVHDETELDRALEIGADVIGINNRGSFRLPEFEERVDLDVTHRLIDRVPAGKTVVSESGIQTNADLDELERIGVDAVLVGTRLMEADDPEQTIRELTQDDERTREHYMDRASEH